MGILKHLLFWPVTGPGFLARFSLEKVQGVVRDELTDDHRVKEALLDLQLRLELGEIDDDEFEREEAVLMQELREVRRWREEFGMGTRGGVVRMAGSGDAAPPAPRASEAGTGSEAEDEPPSLTVPSGTTLEVSLDWETDEDESGEEER
jgi:hypothetical protein